MKWRDIRNAIAVGLCTFGGAMLVLGGARDASAAIKRVHSAACFVPYGASAYQADYIYTYNASEYVVCAMPSDTALPHSSVKTLTVYGYDPAANNYSEVCVMSPNYSYVCGAYKMWGTGYAGVTGIDISVWKNHSTWLPYVWTSAFDAGTMFLGMYASS